VLVETWLSGSCAGSRKENTQPMSVMPSSTEDSVALAL
jgi:hypothetical protein